MFAIKESMNAYVYSRLLRIQKSKYLIRYRTWNLPRNLVCSIYETINKNTSTLKPKFSAQIPILRQMCTSEGMVTYLCRDAGIEPTTVTTTSSKMMKL